MSLKFHLVRPQDGANCHFCLSLKLNLPNVSIILATLERHSNAIRAYLPMLPHLSLIQVNILWSILVNRFSKVLGSISHQATFTCNLSFKLICTRHLCQLLLQDWPKIFNYRQVRWIRWPQSLWLLYNLRPNLSFMQRCTDDVEV